VLAAAGAISREAGAANRVGPDDFEAAAGPACAALLAVRQASYSLAGNVRRISLAEIVEVGRRRSLPVVQILHNAALIDLSGLGLADSTTVSESLRAGADVVIFGGDRLVGGPACGMIVGRRSLLQTIQRHPLARAMQADMLTLAGLGATLRLYCDPERARLEITVLSLLSTGVDNLKNRAERLAPQIAATPRVAQAQPVASSAVLGDRFLCQQEMPTWIIQITPKGVSPERLAADLRVGNPPVVGVVGGEQVVLDLRSVFPRQDYELVDAFSEGHGSPE
jgi:L-seryl-tRNA(Ser) seleniumtransferase